jgi:hypothetical protein
MASPRSALIRVEDEVDQRQVSGEERRKGRRQGDERAKRVRAHPSGVEVNDDKLLSRCLAQDGVELCEA